MDRVSLSHRGSILIQAGINPDRNKNCPGLYISGLKYLEYGKKICQDPEQDT